MENINELVNHLGSAANMYKVFEKGHEYAKQVKGLEQRMLELEGSVEAKAKEASALDDEVVKKRQLVNSYEKQLEKTALDTTRKAEEIISTAKEKANMLVNEADKKKMALEEEVLNKEAELDELMKNAAKVKKDHDALEIKIAKLKSGLMNL